MYCLFIYRLGNYGDSESTVEELSAIYDKKTRLQINDEAVAGDYSFLYAKLMSKDTQNVYAKIAKVFNSKSIHFSYEYLAMTTLTNSEGRV